MNTETSTGQSLDSSGHPVTLSPCHPVTSSGHPVTLSPCHPVTPPVTSSWHPPIPSAWRAWCYLVWLSFQRQARAHQMVWIALILLAVTATVVALHTAQGRWSMGHWRMPRRTGPTFTEYIEKATTARHMIPWSPPAAALQDSVLSAGQAVLEQSGFMVFSSWVVFSVFLSFLLPIWSLSFATEALGGERESRSLVWLLTRPMPRWSIYLAKFVALVPWGLGLNLGGFAVLCLVAGRAGQLAWELYWPAVLCGSLAFCSLFHLLGACFRRAAVLAIVYSFFLETILGNMPGNMKRLSISFYVRCMMFDSAQDCGVQIHKSSEYLPVDGGTALGVLLAMTVAFLLTGMVVFARTEYQDLT